MTTWRDLCRELISTRGPDYYRTLERARKALADGPAVPEGREPASVTQQSTNMPDWRGLCEELLEALDGWHQAVFETGTGWVRPDETYLLDRARAALAQPEPEVEGPCIEDVERLCEEHCFNVEGYESLECLQGLINDALARWGTPNQAEIRSSLGDAPAPVPVPVAEGDCPACEGVPKPGNQPCAVCGRSAPPAEGEVAELAAKLRRLAPHNPLGTADPTITRAADLLEQRHPAPVPVSERLPGPRDCAPWPGETDASAWCWVGSDVDGGWAWEQRSAGCLAAFPGDFTHWLPAHALPLPQGEVE